MALTLEQPTANAIRVKNKFIFWANLNSDLLGFMSGLLTQEEDKSKLTSLKKGNLEIVHGLLFRDGFNLPQYEKYHIATCFW